MKLDLNQTDAGDGWEFIVAIGDQTYETRAPSMGEIQKLSALGSFPRDEAFKLWEGFFVGENRPSIAGLSPQHYTVFVNNFCRYATAWLQRTLPRRTAIESKPSRPEIPQRHTRRFQ